MGKTRSITVLLREWLQSIVAEARIRFSSPLLPIAVLLYILLSGSVMYYDMRVFSSWMDAAEKIGVFQLYRAPELFGYTYRAVYPPLAPLVFLASYGLAEEAVREIVAATGSSTSLGLLGPLVVGFTLRLLLKIPIIASALALWDIMVRRFGRKVSTLILLGPPVLVVIAVYNFDLFMTLFLVLGVFEATRGNSVRAVVYTTIAALFKQPAVVALPLILLGIYRRRGLGEAGKALLVSAAIAAAIVTPFALGSGESFFKWIAGFHGTRPPQGPTVFTAAYTLSGYSFEEVAGLLEASTILMALSLLVVVIAYLYSSGDNDSLVYAVTASLLGILAFTKVVNPVYTLWAYPFIVALSAKKGTLKPVAIYLAGATMVYLWVMLLYFSALVTGTPVYLHEEARWLSAQEFKSMIYASLGPYSTLMDLFLLIGRSSSIVWYTALFIHNNWGLVELVLATIYTFSMAYLYFWLISLLLREKRRQRPGRILAKALQALPVPKLLRPSMSGKPGTPRPPPR